MCVTLGLSYQGKNMNKECFENRMLRKQVQREKVEGGWENKTL
jgi:hypothetical protein